ncbi:MAG TPA: YHS domain-containing (seleno)protein [Thermohalobaculum sp.]|nr:YHS domain-containing (seleno)protein [Thermohalobaculum sp.]
MFGLTDLIRTSLVTALLLLGGIAHADNPPIAVDDAGLALKGYDTVAYFADGQPQPGDPAFSHQWNGATWLFATAEHRDAFKANPEQYAPQFGGYCAFAVSKDHVQKADPMVWSIVDDKLYLNLGPGAQAKWQADLSSNIVRASNNWPGALIDPGKRPKTSGTTESR